MDSKLAVLVLVVVVVFAIFFWLYIAHVIMGPSSTDQKNSCLSENTAFMTCCQSPQPMTPCHPRYLKCNQPVLFVINETKLDVPDKYWNVVGSTRVPPS